MEEAFLIAGLGNPGREYARTRHNAGFLLADILAEQWKAQWRAETRFQAHMAVVREGEKRVLLCQPQTYMNLSGQAVGALTRYYQIPQDRVLIVLDDADLPLGELRLRPQGGSGGHHGLASVIEHLGTEQLPRLRLGIGRPESGGREIARHVLDGFLAEEWAVAERMLNRAAEQVKCWIQHGIAQAMNNFNGMVQTTEQRNVE
ncbi:MAG TPA: aminoacyl-tRNA hydrolase [Candidatus Paceibacterota bacterium]|nr:aminoacyl-tRNA hydrolase [Verrucomicrobiota bacterium]HRY47231.1 aminoacyl-tRNA hydrolase [Candidatus Paceibacterota bacterium]HSA02371.1 aminoacyl-tRNA hydrolase [Candidatus Paceibacterota bacterium]